MLKLGFKTKKMHSLSPYKRMTSEKEIYLLLRRSVKKSIIKYKGKTAA